MRGGKPLSRMLAGAAVTVERADRSTSLSEYTAFVAELADQMERLADAAEETVSPCKGFVDRYSGAFRSTEDEK